MTNLNKFIADSGLCSRRAADKLIKEGRVKINSKLAKPIDKVGNHDIVTVDNKKIEKETKKIWLAFNKPYGVICTTDKSLDNNIMKYMDVKERIFPVGRLDVKSQGLILLTNDGETAQKILKNKTVEKEYLVATNKLITEEFLEKLSRGIKIDGRPTLPAKVKKISGKNFSITIVEGRKRQIRRMCEKLKYDVTELKRIRIGKIELNNIKEGKYIEIPSSDINKLLNL